MKKDRGIFLTLLIILSLVGYVSGVFNGKISPVLIITSIIGIIALVGIWKWKKMAVYLFALMNIIQCIVSIPPLIKYQLQTQSPTEAYRSSYSTSIHTVIIGEVLMVALITILWFIAIKRKWKYFK